MVYDDIIMNIIKTFPLMFDEIAFDIYKIYKEVRYLKDFISLIKGIKMRKEIQCLYKECEYCCIT